MADEAWRPVAEFPGYEVSDLGKVRNARTGRDLRGHRNKRTGRRQVTLRRGGKSYTRRAARLVLIAFQPEGSGMALHLNGDASDDRLENLAWGTHRENMQDRAYHTVCRKIGWFGGRSRPPVRQARWQ